ncbi:MAG TPA: amino acid adenylation domain-containing protein, partial [Thermoanaerobaculia bacterium]|nr:amino acid adenylation domain-containing protein [Thermoanaerobaculia bacterium]
ERYDGIDLLSEAERSQILTAWGDGGPAVGERSLVERFLARAAETPEAVALVEGGKAWSYAELERRSGRLAAYLRSLGVGPESLVGVHLDRSAEMVAALLGILRAGGAYLPLDPAYPAQRLAFMLEDGGVRVALSRSGLPALPAGVKAVELDTAREEIERAGEAPRVEADPDRLAYVIYTSGSTGRPKGVMVSHRGLAAYLGWAHGTYPRGGSLAHTSISFDLTVTSLFVPLLAGERVVLVPESAGPEGLGETLRREEGLGFVKLTPSHLRLLDRQLEGSELAGRTRSLILGGEALSAEDLAAWREHAPETVVYNEYGPTETVVGCSLYGAPAGELASGPVPIGRPIAGARLDLLDAYGTPVPRGVAGELFIGGAGVARGYLARPDLTAARFVPDGLSGASGARLYRTGDLARFRPDGVLEFLGRIDQQVKVRGYRIEPGEIEAAIAAHPGVREAVVLVRGDGADGGRLVAYAVPEGAALPASEELRAHLLLSLPEHMVPVAWVAIAQVPLTPNGKLDREALPDPDEAQRTETPYAAPRTPTEEILAAVWCQSLGIDRAGIDDDYFTLGGDSIRSVQVVGLAREKGLGLTLQQIFQHRTIRRLAEALAAAELPVDAAGREPFRLIPAEDRERLPADVEDAYPLSRLQAGMLYHREASPGSALYHNIGSFHLRAPLDTAVLQRAFERLVARHPVLRTTFEVTGWSEPLQLVHRNGAAEIEAFDLRHLPPEEQEAELARWTEEDKRRGFDASRLPLLRFTVHRRSGESFQLTQSFHHAILDGWSDATMLVELFRDYLSLLAGEEADLAPPAARVADFIALERQALESPEQRAFWDRVVGDSPFTEIPRLAPGSGGPRVGTVEVPVPAEVSDGLARLARAGAVPVKSVLLAAHLRVMALLAGQPDVLTLVTSSGRPESGDGSRVLGLFLNSTPVRVRLSGGTWRELVGRVFEAEREALPYRRFPMSEMMKARDGRPLAEAAFYYTHYHIYQGLQELAQLEVLGYDLHEETNFTLLASFGMEPFSGRLHVHLAYDRRLLGDAQVEEIGGSYARVLAAMAAGPEERYDGIDLLSEAERSQILTAWGDGGPAVGERSLVERFLARAAETPEAVALVEGGKTWSYAELERRSGRLAAYLRGLGVGPESLVGVHLDRSAEMVAALLGILRAGGAYLPLDPAYPAQRLAFMLEDGGVRVALSRSGLPALPAGVQVVEIDTAREEIERAGEAPRVEADPDRLAYVIYTSGSTGRPKGVMVSHRGLAAYLGWAHGTY